MNSKGSNKKNILYISHLSELHGAERVLLLLLKHIDRGRFNPYVILPADGPLKEKLEAFRIETFIIPIKPWICPSGLSDERFISSIGYFLKKNVSKLVDMIIEKKIDLVHTNTSTIIDGAFASVLTETPHIWHLHEILRGNPGFKKIINTNKIFDAISGLSSKVVSVSKVVDSQFKDTPIAKRTVIQNGIDIDRFSGKTSGDIRMKLNIKKETSIVLSVGAIIKEKGYRYLIDAIPGIISRCSDVHFLIAGGVVDENVYKELKDIIEDKGLGNHISFLGYRDDLPSIVREADLFVLPSVKEAFPLSLLEAMASCTPVIATRCGGPEEMIVDGKTGNLVPTCSASAIENAIVELLKDKDKARQMAERARRRVQDFFDIDIFINKWHNLYEDVLEDTRKNTYDKNRVIEVILDLLEISGDKGLSLIVINEQLRGFMKRVKGTLIYKLYNFFKT
ncbi:glycosyltransferase family 4 protein [candidate division WOR-3 bacterium]|nr:glycosyltransferase family 4 protein [candidate division WOR-3 bacterium]